MRIAILNDVHANLPAFESVLEDAEQQGCSRIYHTGDLISIGPYPAEVVDLAQVRGVRGVQGNHDAWVSKGLPLEPTPNMSDEELMHQHWTHSHLDSSRRAFLRTMPYAITETIEGVRFRVVHFALEANGRRFKAIPHTRLPEEEILDVFDDTDVDLLCFGHIHPRQFNRVYKGCHFFNPACVGCSHDSHAWYGTVDFSAGHFQVAMHRVPYDRKALLAEYDLLRIPARVTIRKVFFGVEESD
jgi:putative phosphoesterase